MNECNNGRISIAADAYSFINTAGGLMSRTRKFFGSAKSATRNVATGFCVPGFGYLIGNKNKTKLVYKTTLQHSISNKSFEIKAFSTKYTPYTIRTGKPQTLWQKRQILRDKKTNIFVTN